MMAPKLPRWCYLGQLQLRSWELWFPQFDSEGPNSGNFGFQDHILALRWVKQNIAVSHGSQNRD